MSPEALIQRATALAAAPHDGLDVATAYRAVAFLARQALEDRVAERLVPYELDADEANLTAQLLCLQGTTDDDTARQAGQLWSALSTLTHHHGYELPPTAHELQTLLRRTARLLEMLKPNPTRGSSESD